MSLDQKVRTTQVESAAHEPRLFDIAAAVAYFHAIGADAATVNFVRSLIATGQVPAEKIGKKFYVSKNALDGWIYSHERRRRG